jgi:hypothetical protein
MKNESFPASPMLPIARATLVAGVLDIASAFVYGLLEGHRPVLVLLGIASAVWPGAGRSPVAAAAAGLLLHFAIMLAMASAFVLAARRLAWLRERPVLSGALYGLLLWAVMNLVVLPLRWPALFPRLAVLGVAEQLFSHIVLVGIPIAWLARSIRPVRSGSV